eukprot:gene3082-6043_t
MLMNIFRRQTDARDEYGSSSILNELGVQFGEKSKLAKTRKLQFSDGCNTTKDERAISLLKEHKGNHLLRYHVIQGTLLLDIRDSAGAWLRCLVEKDTIIELKSNLYRKFSVSPNTSCDVVEYYDHDDIAFRFAEQLDSIVAIPHHNTRELVCELCRQFFQAGWVMGTGGSISIRYGNRIYMTPSGVQKERIHGDELFVLDVEGNILCVPNPKPGFAVPKLSDCSPLFLHSFKQRNAGAVLHSHHINCNLATALFDGKSEFRISHQEMIKGLTGYGYFDELVIPIIENTAWEHELADSLGETIARYPKANAVLVRRHGMYVWGATWEQAKRHAECLHYLFDVAINMKRLGMDFLSAPSPLGQTMSNGIVVVNRKRTTTPITFVKDVLFPYASNNVEEYLTKTWDSEQTEADVNALLMQAINDKTKRMTGCPEVITNTVSSISTYVRWLISQDRKVGALKELQGRIWEQGYASGAILSQVYDDVPPFLKQCRAAGVHVSIYSSGSRQAQHLLFKHSNHGDLRSHLSCFFDPAVVGHKRTETSYKEILLTLGVEHASDALFVTDIIQEAEAARTAGMHAVLSVRPGNAVLPVSHSFPVIHSFSDMFCRRGLVWSDHGYDCDHGDTSDSDDDSSVTSRAELNGSFSTYIIFLVATAGHEILVFRYSKLRDEFQSRHTRTCSRTD